MVEFWDILESSWIWGLALSAVFFAKTKFALGLLNADAKAALSLWLEGSYKHTWSQNFCRVFDGMFGDRHFSLKCFLRSTFVSLFTVFGMWFILQSFGTLQARVVDELDLFYALMIGLTVNVLADYLSLLETRFILQHINRVRSVTLQAFVLVLDLVLSAAIILLGLRLFTYAVSEPFSFELTLGAFSIYSVFFFSTFTTSIWTWGFVLSTWFIKSFTRLGLDRILDIHKRPDLMIASFGAVWIVIVVFVLAIPMRATADGTSVFSRLLCSASVTGEVCQAQHRISQSASAKLYYLSSACSRGTAIDRCVELGLKAADVKPEDAYIYWGATCRAGDARACSNLGTLYEDGRGVTQNSEKAAELYRQACSDGFSHSCSNLGVLYEKGLGVPKDFQRAATIYLKSCHEGSAYSCGYLGRLHWHGIGVDKDVERAAALFGRACEDGSPFGCSHLGTFYAEGLVVTKNEEKASELFRQACDAGDAHSCTILGARYGVGRGVSEDAVRAAELHLQACEGGAARGCANLGHVYAVGLGVTKSIDLAVSYLQRGCNGGDAIGCNSLALLYEAGNGVSEDAVKAADLFDHACELGEPSACTNLGNLHERGRGVPRSAKRAAEFYLLGCEGGNTSGCSLLAALYDRGGSLSFDPSKAVKFYELGCPGGVGLGCNRILELRKLLQNKN